MRTIITAICLLAMTGAFAQSTIDGIVDNILNGSPELRSQRQQIEAQKADNADANSLSNPEVTFARVWGRHGIGNKLQLDVSQSFDWPGLYAARSKAARQGVSAAEMLLVNSALDIALQAKQLLNELVYVRRQKTLCDNISNNVKVLQKATDQAFEHGEATVFDVRKLKIEQYKLESSLVSLEARENQIVLELQQMAPSVNLDLSDLTAYGIEPLLTAQEYAQQVAELDPLVASQRFTAEQETQNARAARMSRMPGFSVGYQHQAEMGDRFNGFTVGMSLPVFEGRKARASALARKDAAETSVQMIAAQKVAEINAKLDEMALWRKQIDLYNQTFGDNQYLRLLKTAYDGGQINVLEYLTEVQYYTEISYTQLENEYNYQQALAWLNRYSLILNK